MPDTEVKAKKNNLFDNPKQTERVYEWRRLKAANDPRAIKVLDEIIRGTTLQFHRFAAYEGFTSVVDIDTLVTAAQVRIPQWLDAWDEKKGPLFTWISKCAKYAFLSELHKVQTFRARIHTTDTNLEKFHGVEDNRAFRNEAADAVLARIKDVAVRWADPNEQGALRFLLFCVIDENHDRRRAIKATSYAFGMATETVNFFYAWSLFAMRNELFDLSRAPFTEQDLIRASESYTFFPDLLEIITTDQLKRIIMTMGGQRLRIPTPQNIEQLKAKAKLFLDAEKTDLSPDDFEAVGKKKGKSQKTAQQVYEEMTETLNPGRFGEYSLFDEN